PSRFEAFGIVILEAWACGTPVIVSSSGAMPSIVGEGGLVFETGDPVDLARKLERVLENPELAGTMARRGHERMLERYTWDRIAPAAGRAPLARRGRAGRLRVRIVSTVSPPHTSGGAEIVAHREALVLRDLGVEVEVFAGRLEDPGDEPYRVATEGGRVATE